MRQAPPAKGCRLRTVNFAESKQGQNFFDFLVYIDKSPKEYGVLAWDERDFYLHAWNWKNNPDKDKSMFTLLAAQSKLKTVEK